MRELAERVLGAEEAWVVGGAVRDELLGRPVVDLDIACADPLRAARAYAKQSGGAPFPLSERHGAWRVALDEGRTVDFTPLRGTIEDDLATRDFTVNAIAVPLSGGEAVDPFGGRRDLEELSPPTRFAGHLRGRPAAAPAGGPLRGSVRVSAGRGDDRADSGLGAPGRAAGRRANSGGAGAAVRRRLPAARRARAAGSTLGGSVARIAGRGLRRDQAASPCSARTLERFPLSNDQRRLMRTVLRAERPGDDSPRAIHRFRRATEPWALEALEFLGAPELQPLVEEAAPPRAGRAAPARRRARPPARTRRSAACSSGSRRSAPRARSPRARRLSSWPRASGTSNALAHSGHTSARISPLGSHGEEAGRTEPQGQVRT